ncbi:GNAT family N-acetyltransferase [Salinispora pacifica]|uniref:GNAT family N-acetyltransferase n=1 Tax=Salinispora pacifica TaxID=351187 RepID=UPI0009B8C02A|nr:GNAT family N-acetyltransferase [Salinispora pacifica]
MSPHRLGGPDNPGGDVGHVFNVATDRDCRRRGYSRSCMQALLGWYQQRGVTRAYLQASRDGESHYRALGFAPTHSPTMRLVLPASL